MVLGEMRVIRYFDIGRVFLSGNFFFVVGVRFWLIFFEGRMKGLKELLTPFSFGFCSEDRFCLITKFLFPPFEGL